MKGFSPRSRMVCALSVAALLAACTTATRAPVEDRSPAGVRRGAAADVPAEPAPQPRPGYYVVKKGDTLIGIALEHGQDWRDIASWNGLDNPNLILVGQELRVKSLEGATTKPVLEARPIDAKPLDPKGVSTPTVKADDATRREPRGGKVAYSDQALVAAIKADELARSSTRETKSEPRPEAKPEPRKEPVAEARSDDDIDWAWPAAGKLVGPFNESSNKGIDIAGGLGDPVYAAGSGKIVYVGAGLRGYGNLVIIKHNASFLSAYAHNQKILVKEGQAVKKGQEIATLGDSDAERPKVHFEIRRQGKPVDPVKYLPKR